MNSFELCELFLFNCHTNFRHFGNQLDHLKLPNVTSLKTTKRQSHSQLPAYLHPGVHADQVLAVAVDEVSQWASDFRIDCQEDCDLDEGDQVQGARLVAEEELLVSQHLRQNLKR